MKTQIQSFSLWLAIGFIYAIGFPISIVNAQVQTWVISSALEGTETTYAESTVLFGPLKPVDKPKPKTSKISMVPIKLKYDPKSQSGQIIEKDGTIQSVSVSSTKNTIVFFNVGIGEAACSYTTVEVWIIHLQVPKEDGVLVTLTSNKNSALGAMTYSFGGVAR